MEKSKRKSTVCRKFEAPHASDAFVKRPAQCCEREISDMVREFERLDRNIRRLRIRRRTLVSAVRIVCWWEKCGQLYAYEVDEACRRSEAVAKFAQAAKAVADGALAEWAGRPELERTLAAIVFSAAAAAARARKVYYDRAEYTKEWRLRRQGKDGE